MAYYIDIAELIIFRPVFTRKLLNNVNNRTIEANIQY